MSAANDLIENAKRIRQRLRKPPNAVYDPGIDLTRKSSAHKGDGPIPDAPIKKVLGAPNPIKIQPEFQLPKLFEKILREVSRHYGVSVASLKGSSRRADISYARFVAIHLSLKMKAKLSLSAIARGLNKDHSSAIHARNRMIDIIATNQEKSNEINMIEKCIEDNYRPAVPAFCEFRVAIQPGPGPSQPEVSGLGG